MNKTSNKIIKTPKTLKASSTITITVTIVVLVTGGVFRHLQIVIQRTFVILKLVITAVYVQMCYNRGMPIRKKISAQEIISPPCTHQGRLQ